MKKLQNVTIVSLVMSLILFMLASVAFGQQPVPAMMNYQGRLCDTVTGEPVPDASYSVTFRIYNDETSGTLLWSETQNVTTNKGIFGVLLGGTNPISLSFDEAYWFSVQISGEQESARNPIVSVGYAFRSEYSNDRYTDVEARNAADDITSWSHSDIVTNLNADMLDSLHASSFLNTASDYGRSGVTSILYEDNTALSDKYLGITATAVNTDMVDGYHAGNSSGEVAVSNGTVCTNLNSDHLDGQDGSYYLNWYNFTNVPAGFADNVDNTGITSEADTLDSVCSRGNSTSRSVTVNSTMYSNRFYVSDAGNHNAVNVRNTTPSYPTIWAHANQSTNTVHATNVSDYGPTIWARNEHSNGANCIYGQSNSSSYPTLYIQQDGSHYAGWFQGDLGCSGSKTATVETQSFGHRNLYSDESAEIYFFDRGHAQLTNGTCVINLEPIFLETVTINDSYPMLVQITLTADCKGIFVAEKTKSSFTVRELQGGNSNATFDWEVAAKRKGYENIRMERISIVHDAQAELAIPVEGQEGGNASSGGVRITRGD